MRRANVFVHEVLAGMLVEVSPGLQYVFEYRSGYLGPPVSLTMPVAGGRYEFTQFPPFFDGLLPEGTQLEALLRLRKLDRSDAFGQLVAVGEDMVGAVTVRPLP